jgi:hypothetical protein
MFENLDAGAGPAALTHRHDAPPLAGPLMRKELAGHTGLRWSRISE